MQSLTRFFAKRFDLFLLWDETRLKLDATRTRHWALQSSFGGVVWIMVWYCFSGVVHSFQTNDGRRIPIFASRGTGTSFYWIAIWILSAGDAFNLEVPRLIIFIKLVPFTVSTPTTKLIDAYNQLNYSNGALSLFADRWCLQKCLVTLRVDAPFYRNTIHAKHCLDRELKGLRKGQIWGFNCFWWGVAFVLLINPWIKTLK